MVALNEQLQHCGVPISDGHMSLNVIDGCDFTKRSGEVHGGPVVNFGVSGFCGLSDASPLRRRCAAPPNQSDPETQLYYVRNRTYNPALCTVLGQEPKSPGWPGRASKKIAVLWEMQRDQIGYAGGINLCGCLAGRAVVSLDSMGTWEVDAGVYAAASGSVDFMSGEVTLGGWLWAGIGFQFGQRWWGRSFYTQGVPLHRRFGFLDWITPGKCACGVRGNWWSTGPGFFATLSPGQNNGIRFGPIELGALPLVQPGGDKATIEGVFIWNAVKDLPAGWAVVKVLHFLHLHAAVDIIGTFSLEICPRKGGGITADKAIGSISLALHLGHAPGNIGR